MSKEQKPSAAAHKAYSTTAPSLPFPIVGVGASAGGLEAFTELLKHLPLDTGMAFVLMQHLDPDHESAFAQILSRATKLPVHEVTDSPRVEPDHIYIIPPNTFLSIEKGKLKLEPRAPGRTPHRSVDHFFESLAQDAGERAIGVVLSGAANDGTLGLEAIRGVGGFTLAQDESAKYDSMPRSAIAAGCVDLVLPPKGIAEELARIAHHSDALRYNDGTVDPQEQPSWDDKAALDHAEATTHEDDNSALPSGGSGSPPTGARTAQKEAAASTLRQASGQAGSGAAENGASKEDKDNEVSYKKIMVLLHHHSGVDFSLYKSSTIRRRINRRIVLSRVETLPAYIDFLRGNSKELDALYTDVLISVTSFFRDPEAFDFLKKTVFPKIVPTGKDAVMRIWTLGCSTGQEAYSLAMIYAEFTGVMPSAPKLQLFATDLNETLLVKARAGLYAKSIVNDISPERLRRFFVEEDGGYRIIKSLRESVVFARQNLLSDPPFSRMDLISCRNLLIYIGSSLQKRVMPMFHYALKPKGVLFLGASESVGTFTDHFEPVDRKHKIFTRKPGPPSPLQARIMPTRPERNDAPDITRPSEPEGFRGEVNTQREADRMTRNRYAPPSVLINGDLLVVEFRGDTSPYLKPPIGQASFNLLKMAREGLMLPLRTAINKAKKESTAVRKENIRIEENGRPLNAHLEVVPVKNVKEPHYLVFFEDAATAKPAPVGKEARAAHIAPHAAKNFPAKEQLRRVTELEHELADTRDYLQSMQEQHQAANEELQASGEEVTSANEELKSINEELETSKEELESANEELTTINDEMEGRNVELHRLNSDLLNLQTATNQAIVLLGRDLSIRRFSPKAETQFHLLANDVGRPFSSIRHDLVLAVEEDSLPWSVVKRDGTPTQQASGQAAADSSAKSLRQRNTTGKLTPHALPPGDGHGADDTSGRPYAHTLEELITAVIDEVREHEVPVRDGQGIWYSLRVRPYFTVDNKVDGAVLVLVDIDDLKHAEEVVTAARDYAEAIIRTVPEPVLILDSDLRVITANGAFDSTFQVEASKSEGTLVYELGNGQWDIPALRILLEEILPNNTTFDGYEVEHHFETIGHRIMLINARRLQQSPGDTPKILLGIRDITERRTGEMALGESEAQYRALLQGLATAVYTTDAQGHILLFNEAAVELWGCTPKVGTDLWCGSYKIHRPGGGEVPLDSCLMAEVVRHGQADQGQEFIIERPDGSRRNVLAYPRSLRDAAGQVTGAVNLLVDITERRRAEQERKGSEMRYRNLINTMDQGFCVIDMVHDEGGKPVDYRFAEINPAFEKHSGLHEALGKTMRELAPEHEQFWFDTFEKVWRTGDPVTFIHEAKALDRWFEVEAFRLHDSNGQVGILFNDITERMRNERTTAQLAAIVSSSHDAIISKDLHSIIQTWNQGAQDLFGYTAEEAIGQHVTILMPPDRMNEEPGILHRIVEGQVIDQYETVRQHKDGHLLNIALTISPIRNEEGTIIGASKIARDISSELRAARAMRESEERYSDLFNAMDQGFCVIELINDDAGKPFDWTYVEVNPAFERHTGMANAGGQRASRLFKEVEPSWLEAFEQAMSTGESVHFVKASEEKRWTETSVFKLNTVGNDQLGVLLTDVTDLVEKDRKLLREAQELRDGDRHKNEFLATLAHELRNPLAPLRTGLEVLHEMQPATSPGSEVAAMMQRQVDQIVHLVDDLLDVSRIGSGKIILRKESTDLCQAIHDATESIKPTLKELGQKLIVDLPQHPVMMDGDPARLTQVMSNLLNNASKFSPDQGRIELHAQVDGGQAVIRVLDHGEGICADDLPRIFGLFNQTNSPGRLRENSGLGIGLTLVRDLVLLHGGTVEAQSDGLGKGCTFTVKLPVREDLREVQVPAKRPPATASTARKVLVVDDNEDAAQLLTLILSRKGHTVLSAFNGPDGLKVAAEFKPDLILLDIGLPGMNGHEVAKLIRKAEWGRKLILIALTGWGQSEDREKSKAAGFDHHLVKPVQVEKILELMKGAS